MIRFSLAAVAAFLLFLALLPFLATLASNPQCRASEVAYHDRCAPTEPFNG